MTSWCRAYSLMLTMLPGIALGLSMEVLVGHAVGERRLRAAHRRVLQALGMGLACSVLLAAAVAGAAPGLLAWFTQDAQIIALATTALWLTVLL